MFGFQLDRFLQWFANIEPLVGLVWLGLVALTVTLLVLMRTRWGQSKPLRKCLVLSVLAHLLLAGYATTVRIVSGMPPIEEPVLRVSLIDGSVPQAAGAQQPTSEKEPWEQFLHERVSQPQPVDPEREIPDKPPELERRTVAEETALPSELPPRHLAMVGPDVELPEPEPQETAEPLRRTTTVKEPESVKPPQPRRRPPVRPKVPDTDTPARRMATSDRQPAPVRRTGQRVPTSLLEQPAPLPRLATRPTTPDPAEALASLTDRLAQPGRFEPAESVNDDLDRPRSAVWTPADAGQSSSGGRTGPGPPSGNPAAAATPHVADSRTDKGQGTLPNIYRLRVAPDRSRQAQQRGATRASEAAVAAALKWLAENQMPDGRWDAGDHGAGREQKVAGRDRQNAGIEADTATTALSLLAFLASGHTHLKGPYRENVRRGLEFLLRAQAEDGNLSGRATAYAKMYCHSMAAFAMSEAYGMSGDSRLQQPVRRAIAYTLAAQSPADGGWRYRPGDPGDTSQAGWQLMALKSAELAGIPMPTENRNRLILFLRSVSSGKHGGLASYRSGQPVTRPMTAEALACWQFLGMPREHPAGNEAGDYLLGELPGREKANLYYWYYGTLAMYQLQGAHWQRWNQALQTTLVSSQRREGPLGGTWDPDTVWGGYGGRVYSTALATLCLEVYYRFLPLYVQTGPAGDRTQ